MPTSVHSLTSSNSTTNLSTSLIKTQEEIKKKIWIDAWYDPLASNCVHSQCMALADLNGDGDFKLVAGFSGTSTISDNVLLEEPIAVCSYYMDYKTPRRPVIAIGCASGVYLYKNMQGYHKFFMPTLKFSDEEIDIWNRIKSDKVDYQQAYNELLVLRDERRRVLSTRSAELLMLNDTEQLREFIDIRKDLPLTQSTILTCMTVLRKDKEEEDSVGCLVLGCENKRVYILEPTAAKILKEVELPAVPTQIIASGRFDVEYRIFVACRNGAIYTIKNGLVSGSVIELESQPCAIARLDKLLAVACMDNTIHIFNNKAKRQYTIFTGHTIKNMVLVDMKLYNNQQCLAVALGNRELRLYNGKQQINSFETAEIVTGMVFGNYGSEPNTLALSYRNGGLEFKVVSRKASLDAKGQNGPPPEQDVPLPLPSRTALYLEFVDREKALSTEMHRIFQRELCRLRVTTAKSYLKVLGDGQSPISYTGSQLRLNAVVQGLGPLFKIKLSVQNTGTKPKYNLPVVFSYNQGIYSMKKSTFIIPVLVPSLQYKYSSEIELIDPQTGSDSVKVFLCNQGSQLPLITAILRMPISEVDQPLQ